VKRLRLINELTKAKSQIVVYKKKLPEAKEHYRTLVIEELAMSSLLPQAAEEAADESTDESDEVTTAEGDGVIYIIHDGKAVCVPRTEIIYLSDIVNVISGSSPPHFTGNYQHECYGIWEIQVLPPPWREGGSTQSSEQNE
jgi:hypothetical protein